MAYTAPTTDPTSQQFTLRSLLVLTTAAAVLAAIGSLAGRGWALVLIGVFLALANYLGILAVVQRPRFAQVVLYLAMIPFAVSFFLPAIEIFGMKISGWEYCYRIAAKIVAETRNQDMTWFDWVMLPAFCYVAILGNIAMLALPVMAHRVVAGNARWYMYVLTVAAAGTWLAFTGGLYFGIGYFVWCGALTVPVVIVRLKRGQLIVLLVTLVATATVIWFWWESQKVG